MSQAKGSKAQLLKTQPEATYGTTPSSPSAVKMPIISSSLSADKASIEAREIRGRRDPAAPGQGNTKASGSIVVPVDINNFGYWLALVLGAPATTGTDPYTHIYQVKDTTPSVVLENGYSDINQYHLYNGCKVNSMALKFDARADANLEATLEVIASKETQATSSVDATPDTLDFERFNIGDLALKEGGSTIANVLSCDLTINNNHDAGQYVIGGGGVIGDLPPGIVAVTGSITALFEDDTLLAKARAATESSLEITLTSGADSLELVINELLYGYKSPGITGPQGVVVTLPFNAYYDNNGTDETTIQATLVNSQATYSG